MHHYIYDASGERVLKASSDYEATYENGTLLTPSAVTFNSYTTYPSAFMVVNADGVFSKHYYAGSQRIVSRLGNATATAFDCSSCATSKVANNNKNQADDTQLQQAQIADLQLYMEKAKKGKAIFADYSPQLLEDQEKAIAEEATPENTKTTTKTAKTAAAIAPIYYYHPDHLGTSTFLTDANGNAYQFFLNLPYGETMAEQLGNNYYNTPYKFNGKELDADTGLYYYGARYYDPKTSIWLSVDPLAEKYPSYSPYNYCANNPINMIDPDGRDWYRNNKTGAIAWRDGSTKIKGYKKLGFSVSNQSYGKNKTDHLIIDGSTKLITVNGNIIADFNKGSSGSLIKSGFTIWGDDRSGDTSGQKGNTTDSWESDDIPTLGNGDGTAGSIFSKVDNILDQIIKFFEIADAAGDTMDRVQWVVTQVKKVKEEADLKAKNDKSNKTENDTTTTFVHK